jgi:hypothetical protein
MEYFNNSVTIHQPLMYFNKSWYKGWWILSYQFSEIEWNGGRIGIKHADSGGRIGIKHADRYSLSANS